MATWNERLKRILEERGLRGVDVARAAGVSSPTVTAWLDGTTQDITGANLLKLCDYLRISPWYLLFERGDPQAPYMQAPPEPITFAEATPKEILTTLRSFIDEHPIEFRSGFAEMIRNWVVAEAPPDYLADMLRAPIANERVRSSYRRVPKASSAIHFEPKPRKS